MSMPIDQLEVLFLGTGTSAGIPIIACDCSGCTSSDPRDRRTRCSLAVSFVDASGSERVILIDASPDLREQALRHSLQRCDAILFTHEHVDHTFGLDEVRRFNAVMRAPIDIWAEPNTMDCLRRIYRYIFEKERNANASFVATLVPRTIDPDQPIDLFGLRFTPVRLFHGRLPVLGFRIEAIDDDTGEVATVQPAPLPFAYCTDVSSIPDATWGRLGGLRHVVLDLLRYKEHPTHFSADEAVAAGRTIGAERTWFVHMAHDVLHAELDPELPDGMALAWDGMTLPMR